MNPAPFRVVLVDPPWEFLTRSAKGKGKSPEQHYSCMSLAQLNTLGPAIRAVCAPDAVLLLWTVDPLLPEAISMGFGWGFSYRTVAFTWTKRTKNGHPHMGCGYYTRANPEQCLLFRLRHGVPVASHGVRQWIDAPLGKHSEKPEESYARIERLFGDVPMIELFARRPRPGWTCLGNEIDGRDIRLALEELHDERQRSGADLADH